MGKEEGANTIQRGKSADQRYLSSKDRSSSLCWYRLITRVQQVPTGQNVARAVTSQTAANQVALNKPTYSNASSCRNGKAFLHRSEIPLIIWLLDLSGNWLNSLTYTQLNQKQTKTDGFLWLVNWVASIQGLASTSASMTKRSQGPSCH